MNLVLIISIGNKVTSTHVALWIDLHLRHRFIKLHVLLADGSASLHGFDAFLESICLDDAFVD